MKILLQRVKKASCKVNNEIIGKIDNGLLLFVGFKEGDNENVIEQMAKKCVELRIFSDENGKMNLSLKDVGGELLIISQFTLYADTMSSGNRPSFIAAARPEKAEPLYEYFLDKCRQENIKVEKGIFGAEMKVSLVNDGPVTIILEK